MGVAGVWIRSGASESPKGIGVISDLGVEGLESDFVGTASSARREERSTVSKNEMAASKLTRQYAVSPSIRLDPRNRCMKFRSLITFKSTGGIVISA